MSSRFENLSDDEIRNELISHGVNIGPVTPSTRNLYIKRLANLSGGSSNTSKTTTPNRRRSSPKAITRKEPIASPAAPKVLVQPIRRSSPPPRQPSPPLRRRPSPPRRSSPPPRRSSPPRRVSPVAYRPSEPSYSLLRKEPLDYSSTVIPTISPRPPAQRSSPSLTKQSSPNSYRRSYQPGDRVISDISPPRPTNSSFKRSKGFLATFFKNF